MDGFNLHVDINPRWRDFDALGHVNNAVYLTYLEEARAAYCRGVEVFRDWGGQGVGFVIVRVEADFKAAIAGREPVRVWIRARGWREKTFQFEYRMENPETGRLFCTAQTLAIGYDLATKRAVALPAEDLERMKAFEAGQIHDPGA